MVGGEGLVRKINDRPCRYMPSGRFFLFETGVSVRKVGHFQMGRFGTSCHLASPDPIL